MQVIVSSPEITGLIRGIIGSYSALSVPVVPVVVPDVSVASPPSIATMTMSIATEKNLWTRAFQVLSANARKTTTSL